MFNTERRHMYNPSLTLTGSLREDELEGRWKRYRWSAGAKREVADQGHQWFLNPMESKRTWHTLPELGDLTGQDLVMIDHEPNSVLDARIQAEEKTSYSLETYSDGDGQRVAYPVQGSYDFQEWQVLEVKHAMWQGETWVRSLCWMIKGRVPPNSAPERILLN